MKLFTSSKDKFVLCFYKIKYFIIKLILYLKNKKIFINMYIYIEVAIGRGGPGQNWAGPKLARFFRAKILTTQPVLKTGPIGPNSLFKAKKIRAGWAGPYRAGPNLARFFSGQKFNGPARP